ncbi:hypothetical protein GCM10010347_62230 [Streptomyces cirratus]|uniref:Uncharacterized protein n=1 Tax=Streptomyces cirratus TaxID=68187 RepID=A0ABQ3F4N1_9ACTN|nr:hypothetical protein GCM10010347_62230 [Streptomyces cirratus]
MGIGDAGFGMVRLAARPGVTARGDAMVTAVMRCCGTAWGVCRWDGPRAVRSVLRVPDLVLRAVRLEV